jgi:hypothetical protein
MIYSITNYLGEGKKVESRFAQDCDELIREATKKEDIYQHWDVIVKINNEEMKVDVKGIKRIKRNEPLNENIHWIEIKRDKKYLGWLYGQADCFAFEMNDKWIVVEKKSLQDFIAENTIKEYKDAPTLYHLYKRPSKLFDGVSILTLVESEKLIQISKYIVPKNNIV